MITRMLRGQIEALEAEFELARRACPDRRTELARIGARLVALKARAEEDVQSS